MNNPSLAAIVLMSGALLTTAAIAADPEGVPMSRDWKYWRGPREATPGKLVCKKPAATGVTVTCDRWPDATDLRRFGLDAIRLAGAKTDHQKAIAVWRWTRRVLRNTDGNAPAEVFQRARGGYVDDPIKQLNVNGAHWCDGQSRVVEAVWRALGYRAEKLYRSGHTMADCFYADDDGVGRWHLFDVSEGGYMLSRKRRRVLSPEEMGTRFYNRMFTWFHCQHLAQPTHRVELAFRLGERLERIWGNWSKPYQDNYTRGLRELPDWERGPYKTTYGNGRWTLTVDPTEPGWQDDLAEAPVNLLADEIRPAIDGKPATAVWHIRTPYIVSDAEVELDLYRNSRADVVRLHLSLDEGNSWQKLWECPADVKGRKKLTVPICKTLEITGESKPPAEPFNSPFGRYAYRLKLELKAAKSPADLSVSTLKIRTTVQHNMFAMPQLHPGRNAITVRGELAKDAAVRVTYLWTDADKTQKRNVTVVERTPHTYEILAAGERWDQMKCKSLLIEAIEATGAGNRTEIKEPACTVNPPESWRPAAETRRRWIRPDPKKLPPVEQLIADLAKDPKTRKKAIRSLMELADPKAFDAVTKAAYDYGEGTTKECALVTLYVTDAKRARPILLDIATAPDRSKWKHDPANPAVTGGHWISGVCLIGAMAAEQNWREFGPLLVKALASDWTWGDTEWALLRSLGRLGEKKAVPLVKKYLADKSLDTVAVAAEAAGKLGDASLMPPLRKVLTSGYVVARCHAARSLGQLGDTASAATIRKWLTHRPDENVRAAAADALGLMGDGQSAEALRAALAAEPFPWVREAIRRALDRLPRL